MKRYKRSLVVLLALLLVLVCVPVVGAEAAESASGTCGNKVTWVLEDGTLTISGTGAMTEFSRDGNVPWSAQINTIESVVIEKGVTTVGSFAFAGCSALTSVELPNSLIRLGVNAFQNCTALRTVTLPSSLTSIKALAFEGCESLERVYIPASVTEIGSRAFARSAALTEICVDAANTTYTSVDGVLFTRDMTVLHSAPTAKAGSYTIPDSVTTIYGGAFIWCQQLTEVTIPASVASIQSYGFYGCTALKNVLFIGSAPKITSGSFYRVSANVLYYPDESWTEAVMQNYDGTLTWTPLTGTINGVSWAMDTDRTLTISGKGAIESQQSPALSPFYGMRALVRKVVIEEGVTDVGDHAFNSFTALKEVSIAEGHIRIGQLAFNGCKALETVELPTGLQEIGSAAFQNCTALKRISLPESITVMGNSIFKGCSALTDVNIPTGVTHLQGSTFYKCISLEAITIPNGIIAIGGTDFFGCTALTSIELPDSVAFIESSAFNGCSSLTDVRISSGIRLVNGAVFGACSNLQYTIYDNAKYLGNEQNPYLLLVSAVSKDITGCTIHPNTKAIAGNSFLGCTALTEIVVPDGVRGIGTRAFNGCSELTSVTIHDSIDILGEGIFQECTKLELQTDAQARYLGVEGNPYYALIDILDTNITEGIVHEGTKLISSGVYVMCSNMTILRVPKSLMGIGSYISLPANSVLTDVYYDGSLAQWNEIEIHYANYVLPKAIIHTLEGGKCGENLYWKLENGVLTIYGNGAMYDYDYEKTAPWFDLRDQVQKLVIEEGVTHISCAFIDLRKMTEVFFPEGLESISELAFDGCFDVKRVNIPSLYAWCSIQFGGLTSHPLVYARDLYVDGVLLKELVIPKGITALCDYAFEGSSITSVVAGEQMRTVGAYTFRSCQELETVHLDGVVTIGEYAFNACTAMKRIYLSEKLKQVDDSAFSFCDSLEEVEFGSSANHIGSRAFENCKSLKRVLFRRDVAGKNEKTLSDVDYAAEPVGIDDYAFQGCSELTELIIEGSVTRIGTCAFDGCTELKTVKVGAAVERIESAAFAGCTALKEIRFEGAMPELGDGVFGSVEATVYYDIDEGWTEADIKSLGQTMTTVVTKLGDFTGDLAVGNDDVIWLLWSTLFGEEAYPVSGRTDFTDDGVFGNDDVIWLLWHTLFGAEEYPLK